jgi:type II secretory pathway pseudopilin PulG
LANPSVSNGRRQPGFSYVEILLSVVLLAVLAAPALEALQSGIAGSRSSSLAASQLVLRDKMERVLAKPFADLYSETYLPGGNTTASISASLSDPAGAPDRRNVTLYRYDAATQALSASDTGLVLVSVYYEAEGSAHALNTLVGGWW